MKRNLSPGIAVTLLLTTLGIHQGISVTKLEALVMAQSISFDCLPLGQIIQAGDNAQRRRAEWVKFSATSKGVILCAGDRLRIEDNSSAEVQCFENNTSIKVSPKVDWLVDDYCRVPSHVIPDLDGGPFPRPRGSSGQLNVVSPRNTSILTLRPTFYWNSVEKASYYQVQLKGYQVNWSESKITATQLIYPPAEPELQPGNTYSLIISAYSDENPKEIAQERVNFSIPTQATIKLVHQYEQQIQQNFVGETQLLVLATLYQQNNLNLEAIKLLEKLQQQEVSTADLALRLSKLYVRVQQYNAALKSYQKAFQLAKDSENLGVQVEAAYQIGELYTVMNNETESEQWLAIATHIDQQLKQESLN